MRVARAALLATRVLALRILGLRVGRGGWHNNQRLRRWWGWLDDFPGRAVGVGSRRDGVRLVALIMR